MRAVLQKWQYLDHGNLSLILCAMVTGLLEEDETLQHLLSKAGSEPRLFLVDYMEPYRSYAALIDAQDSEEYAGQRKQHAGRLLLYKQ